MGINNFFSKSSYDYNYKSNDNLNFTLNPNPLNYQIINFKKINNYLILIIFYPDCNNYEGLKILFFNKGITINDLKKQGSIDPHFSENDNFISPIARFEPTKKGLEMAIKLAEILK